VGGFNTDVEKKKYRSEEIDTDVEKVRMLEDGA
jgi:hypothetical protein